MAQVTSTIGGHVSREGNFTNTLDKLLGLKFVLDGRTYYDWARFDILETPSRDSYELVDYAYEDTPDQPIRAGQESRNSRPAWEFWHLGLKG